MKLSKLVKKLFLFTGLIIFGIGGFAQEKEQNKIKIRINKDGKAKIDTVISFETKFDKSKLKEILSDIVDDEFYSDNEFDDMLQEIDIDISIDEDGKEVLIKRISEKDGVWTIKETKDFSGDKKKSKSASSKAYVVSTKGDVKFDVFEEEGEEVYEYFVSGDKGGEDEYIVITKSKDGKNEIIKKKKPVTTKKGNVWVSKSSEKGKKLGYYIMKDNDKDEYVTIYNSGDEGLHEVNEDVYIVGKNKKMYNKIKSDSKVIVKEGDFMWESDEAINVQPEIGRASCRERV